MKLLSLSWNHSQIVSFQILLIQMTENMFLSLNKQYKDKKQKVKKNSSLKLMLKLMLANQMMEEDGKDDVAKDKQSGAESEKVLHMCIDG